MAGEITSNVSLGTVGAIGRIPIRNIWLLMFYASDLFRQIGQSSVAVEESPDELPDLVGEILAHSVEQRLRRNLSFGYRFRHAELSRVRGKIDLLNTERHLLLARGKVACRFEELTIDTPRNRFVLSALELIANLVTQINLAHRCRRLAGAMKQLGVAAGCSTRFEISTDRMGRNDASDKLVVAAAKLAFDLALPTEGDGRNFLFTPGRDEIWARHLFERAIGGFYSAMLSSGNWKVTKGRSLRWQIESKTAGIDALFPLMKTDIVLDDLTLGRRIVIDTKFTSILMPGWHRDESFRSGYIYQIYTYLMSQSGTGNSLDQSAAGLLLHPSIGTMIDETVVIQGHPIRFATVDLACDATDIRKQLMDMVNFSLQ